MRVSKSADSCNESSARVKQRDEETGRRSLRQIIRESDLAQGGAGRDPTDAEQLNLIPYAEKMAYRSRSEQSTRIAGIDDVVKFVKDFSTGMAGCAGGTCDQSEALLMSLAEA